jgi:hypothetical protein
MASDSRWPWFTREESGMRDSGSTAQRSVEADHRLERIEHAIDAMAVEVERISEGQRFVTKLLADRGQSEPASRHHTPGMKPNE